MIRAGIVALLIACWGSVVAHALPITILYTNDLHVRLDRLESLERVIAKEREAAEVVLLFDAGDTWQDHRRVITNVWGDTQMVEWMNAIGYSAMALGNHDTYWGPERLAELSARAQFPIVCANWMPAYGGGSEHTAATVLRVNGMSILIVGLITAEFLPTPAYPQLQYRSPVVALREQMDLHEGAFDLAFVVSHISIAAARAIAREVPGIALFITGHSHERTHMPIQVGTTWIVQSGAFAQTVGRLRVDMRSADGGLILLSNDLIPIERTPVDSRAGVLRLLGVLSTIALASLVWLL